MTVIYLDTHTKTTEVQILLEPKGYTSYQDGGHIELTWPMFDIILLSIRERDGII